MRMLIVAFIIVFSCSAVASESSDWKTVKKKSLDEQIKFMRQYPQSKRVARILKNVDKKQSARKKSRSAPVLSSDSLKIIAEFIYRNPESEDLLKAWKVLNAADKKERIKVRSYVWTRLGDDPKYEWRKGRFSTKQLVKELKSIYSPGLLERVVPWVPETCLARSYMLEYPDSNLGQRIAKKFVFNREQFYEDYGLKKSIPYVEVHYIRALLADTKSAPHYEKYYTATRDAVIEAISQGGKYKNFLDDLIRQDKLVKYRIEFSDIKAVRLNTRPFLGEIAKAFVKSLDLSEASESETQYLAYFRGGIKSEPISLHVLDTNNLTLGLKAEIDTISKGTAQDYVNALREAGNSIVSGIPSSFCGCPGKYCKNTKRYILNTSETALSLPH